MSAANSVQGTFTVDPEDYAYVDGWKQQALMTLSNNSAQTGIFQPIIRPLRANDLNTSYDDIFNSFTMSSTANNASAVTSSGFTTATGKAYAILGFRDLTAGTKSVTGLQVVVNGKNIPLQNIPVAEVQTNEESAVYFSPIYALQPNQSLTVNLYGYTASASVNVQIIGFIAESGGNR